MNRNRFCALTLLLICLLITVLAQGAEKDVPQASETADSTASVAKEVANDVVQNDVVQNDVQAERENVEAEVFGENEVHDIHLKTIETLELSPETAKEAEKVSQEYVDAYLAVVARRAQLEFLNKENDFLAQAGGERGDFSRFLTRLRAVKDSEMEDYAPMLMQILQDGTAPALDGLQGVKAGLEVEADKTQEAWKELHDTLVQREFLQFELESNRHIVTQIASMFSMDKRWFWLLGVVAFGALVLAVWHDRRHEIRRWLNGGRARQMKLAQILTVCFFGIVAMMLVSFFMGETIYRIMLDMTFRTTAPQAVYTTLGEKITQEGKSLDVKISNAENNLKNMQKAWMSATEKQLDDTEAFMASWKKWRAEIGEITILTQTTQEVEKQIRSDMTKLEEINGKMGALSGDTLFFLRIKHLVRFLLGTFLALATFLGIACFWGEVHARRARMSNVCPHCLSSNTLQPCDENGLQMPAGSKSRQVMCTKVVQESPYEVCGYRFDRIYQPLTKLSFPTLGIPQVGKTHWLTMLYWEIQNKYYPKLNFSCVQSSVTEEMDRRVDEIMNYRMGTAATQRDSIPLPLVLKYRDKDPLGVSEVLADIFDYSGEITTDATRDDYRRERALRSEGFLFFLDPTYPWRPQAEALKRFRRDLKSVKGLRKGESLHLPIAVCLTKIDLLPLVSALGSDAEAESIRFYEELGRIDPTGMAMNRTVIDRRSIVTDELRKKIWPDWDMEAQINDLFGGRYKFFPLTPVGLDGVGEADLRLRTIAPVGLVEPLVWLLEMSGYPTLDKG